LSKRVLIAGESWVTHSIHQKGFDSFTTTEYNEGGAWLLGGLKDNGWTIDYQPSHVAARDFPHTADELGAYDCVMLSDIGANTLLLHPDTFTKSKPLPNRLHALRDYVANGGGLVMVGGYLTFQGIDAKGQYAGTAIEETLPVTLMRADDRVESPQGVKPAVADAAHPMLRGVPADWPELLGYNRVSPKPGATLVASVGDDPLLVAGRFGKGRGVAFTSDCGPHWAPPPFVEWPGYATLWNGIAEWAGSLR
jgi:uncharacterized membrane protein